MPASSPERTACLECDLLLRLGEVRAGERATCPRCGHFLTARGIDWQTRSLAFALAAAVLLVMANSFPFLSLYASGLESVMTLPRSAVELYRQGYPTIAVLVLGPIVVVPALMLAILLAVLLPLRARRPAPWLVPGSKLLFRLGPWSMAEVFLIGVLVSMVKIGAMAKVVLGISFWAYAGFAICFTAAIATLDRVQLWREIEATSP